MIEFGAEGTRDWRAVSGTCERGAEQGRAKAVKRLVGTAAFHQLLRSNNHALLCAEVNCPTSIECRGSSSALRLVAEKADGDGETALVDSASASSANGPHSCRLSCVPCRRPPVCKVRGRGERDRSK